MPYRRDFYGHYQDSGSSSLKLENPDAWSGNFTSDDQLKIILVVARRVGTLSTCMASAPDAPLTHLAMLTARVTPCSPEPQVKSSNHTVQDPRSSCYETIAFCKTVRVGVRALGSEVTPGVGSKRRIIQGTATWLWIGAVE